MTLQSSGQITALDILVESKRTNGTWFDINQSVFRSVAKKTTVNSQISYADFYGRSYQKDFKFGTSGAANYCTNPVIGYLSDYITGVSVGDTFQVVIAFAGSWAPINGQYPAIEVYCTYGVAQYFDFAGNAGGKVAHMTFSYNGGDVITLSGYYSGGSTSFPCATVYLLNLSYPEPQNRGSGYTNTGVDYTTYLYYNPATHGFINHYTPPPPPPDTGGTTVPAPDVNSCFLKGSPVAMADGTFKPIEDVKIGEMLLGAYGVANPVLALNRPLLGDRMMSNINDEHVTTLDHAHLRPDNTFGAVSLYEYVHGENNTIQKVIVDADGTTEMWLLPGFAEADMDLITQIEIGDMLVTVDGSRQVTSLEMVKLPADTQLYNFVMGGDHTYFVSDYCVTGFLNGIDFDYRNWKPVGQSWTRKEYHRP